MSEITYTKQGDYLIPDLTLPTEPEIQLGRYALMHRDYLEKHKRVTYLNLLTSGELNTHLHQTEQAALQRLELLTKQLASEQGVTEDLKEKAPMQWLGLMNNIRSQAEEVILTELIYKPTVRHGRSQKPTNLAQCSREGEQTERVSSPSPMTESHEPKLAYL